MTTEHTIEAHFEVNGQAQATAPSVPTPAQVQDMITTRMANAALGGMFGANAHNDILAKAKATEAYVMVITMLNALQDLGLVKLK